MRKIKYGKYLLLLIFVMSIVYSGGDVGSSKVAHADETTETNETTYDNFYEFNELPESDIDLSHTFELITAGRENNENDGSSVDPNRDDVVIITRDKQWQFGGLWYKNPIDMEKDFSMLMYVNLGDKWNNGSYVDNNTRGGDGITFTIQGHTNTSGVPLSSTIGANGAGLGAYSKDSDTNDPFNYYRNNFIRNALVLEFDTFYNNLEPNTNDNGTPNFGDGHPYGENGAKFYGHIDLTKTPGADQGQFYKQHDISEPYFRSPDNLYDATNQDLTDNRWRKVEVSWDSSTHTLTYDIAGYSPIVYQFGGSQDVIETFGGTEVYWGFTGSTGDSYNLQQVGIFEVPDQTESSIEKLARNITKDGENAEFTEEAIMKLGDTIEYQVTLDYPAEVNTQDIVAAVIEDELPTGLNYVNGSLRVQKNGSDIDLTPDWNNGKIDLGNFSPGSTFVVTYQAVVTEEVIIENTATFYSRYTAPISDTAQVYSGSINILKVDGTNQPLEGAEFTIEGPNDFSVNLPRDEEASSSTYKLDYLEPGEYTITETKAPDGYLPAAPQTATVSKGTVDLEVTFTNYRYPSVSKAQKNSFADDEEYGDTSDTLVGDFVDFRITSSLPKDFQEYKEFRIKDKLDPRLTYVEESAQLFANSSIELELTTDYTVQLINDSLVVELTATGIDKLSDTTELYLTFTTQVNETALENLTSIPNQSSIEFINQSDQIGSSESNETNTTSLTGRVDILKIFKNDSLEEMPLSDAVFRLQVKSGETWSNFGTEQTSKQTSNQDGELHWKELPKGEYRIIEIEAPEGFLLLANPIEFEITSENTTHAHSYVVENIPREELPQTGGIGTATFTITGLLLMMSAGFSSLITRIKKNNYKKEV